jgi:nanoRNase/pAp phosphatase (c-di-AMP/oligoRNAs hydrolase)
MTPRLQQAIRDTLRFLRNSSQHELADALAQLMEEDHQSLDGIELWPHSEPDTWWVLRPYGYIRRSGLTLNGTEIITDHGEIFGTAEEAARAVIHRKGLP